MIFNNFYAFAYDIIQALNTINFGGISITIVVVLVKIIFKLSDRICKRLPIFIES